MKKEYQIVHFERKRPEGFTGGDGDFDYQGMQEALNSLAAEGWRVASWAAEAAFYGKTERYVAVLEKDG